MIPLRTWILHELGPRDWLPDEGGLPEDADYPKFGHDRKSRKMLRILANGAVKALVARSNGPYASDLRRVRPIRSSATAHAAAGRLLRVGSWVVMDHGDEAGVTYSSAARLAELVQEHYCGWEMRDNYADVAGFFVSAVEGAYDPGMHPVVQQALEDLRAVE